MSWTFLSCLMIAFGWMGLFYLWGRSFLKMIHDEQDLASSILFGYLILQIIYQLFYLPIYLTRGSYRVLSYSWLIVIIIFSVFLILNLRKRPNALDFKTNKNAIIWSCVTGLLVLGLAVYIALHVPFYGADTLTYISTMNNAFYQDTIWIRSGVLSFHQGLCSMFHFFTVPSLLTGIKPYYISLFTVRIVGVCLFSLTVYRTGMIVFSKEASKQHSLALILAVLVPFLLMFWGSNYTAEFFYWRINEAKGYCQFILLPLGFSVFLNMLKDNTDRTKLWKEQLLLGLAAIPVSSSSMTAYLFLLLMGTFALLTYDKLKHGIKTIGYAIMCALPNIFYLVLYTLTQNRILTF